MTREDWLLSLMARLGPLWDRAGFSLPSQVRLTCGFPYRSGGQGSKAIGQCWAREASADGTHEILICPTLSDPLRVGDVLVHELVHATIGTRAGHGPMFKRVAVAVGLTGKMTATTASPALRDYLARVVETIGPYPHAELSPSIGRKKQGTRLLKVVCRECGYTVRVTMKWVLVGLPVCPCGEGMTLDDA